MSEKISNDEHKKLVKSDPPLPKLSKPSPTKNKSAYFACVVISALIIMPYNSITQSSQYWKYLYGSSHMGAINWFVSIPAPIITLIMLKLDNLLTIKTRLLFCWLLQIPLSALLMLLPYLFQNGDISFSLSFYFFLSVVLVTAILFAVGQSTFYSF